MVSLCWYFNLQYQKKSMEYLNNLLFLISPWFWARFFYITRLEIMSARSATCSCAVRHSTPNNLVQNNETLSTRQTLVFFFFSIFNSKTGEEEYDQKNIVYLKLRPTNWILFISTLPSSVPLLLLLLDWPKHKHVLRTQTFSNETKQKKLSADAWSIFRFYSNSVCCGFRLQGIC